jgi:hypothetical protein
LKINWLCLSLSSNEIVIQISQLWDWANRIGETENLVVIWVLSISIHLRVSLDAIPRRILKWLVIVILSLVSTDAGPVILNWFSINIPNININIVNSRVEIVSNFSFLKRDMVLRSQLWSRTPVRGYTLVKNNFRSSIIFQDNYWLDLVVRIVSVKSIGEVISINFVQI